MYDELYESWKRELQNAQLEKLPSVFYSRVADYLKKLREESRMIDKKTVKARLLKSEMRNANHMLRKMMQARYRKLLKRIAADEKVPNDFLTVEEEKLSAGVLPFVEAYRIFTKGLLRGQSLYPSLVREYKNAVLRFLKGVPAIIGADIKSYGPFKVEDVASLPIENAKILVKHGLAEEVEVD
jgi:DNA replication factor GINS